MKVVFPAPFGPPIPTVSPGAIDNETLSTATSDPKRTVALAHSNNAADGHDHQPLIQPGLTNLATS